VDSFYEYSSTFLKTASACKLKLKLLLFERLLLLQQPRARR
jgi:hypothetical protein